MLHHFLLCFISFHFQFLGKTLSALGEDPMTFDQFVEYYTQFQQVAGCNFSQHSNSVQMRVFDKSFFWCAYDLSTNGER